MVKDKKARPQSSADQSASTAIAFAFRRGDPGAVRQVRDRVRRIIGYRRYRIQAVDRKDLEQEVMTQLWQAASRSTFDPGAGFWGFVEVVASRRCIDWFRSRRLEEPLDDSFTDAGEDPLEKSLAMERSELMTRALGKLDKESRELILLQVGAGKSYRELATLLGRSEGALRVQMHRSVKKMKSVVDELTDVSREEAEES